MTWEVEYTDVFGQWFAGIDEDAQDAIIAVVEILGERGPGLGRPLVDTIKGSRHANMKELRFDADNGVWRVAFAFDTKRQAILLVAGDKSGGGEKRFYRQLIRTADKRFDDHLEVLTGNKKR